DEQRAWTARSRFQDLGMLHNALSPRWNGSPCLAHTITKGWSMIAVSPYKIAQLTPDAHPTLDHVQHLLDEHAREGWELVTTFQFAGAVTQPVDQMTQSLSNMTSTIFIFRRAA